MSFQEESGRFFFHFREVFEKCIEYIGKFLIYFREFFNFCQKVLLFLKNFYQFYSLFPGVSLMITCMHKDVEGQVVVRLYDACFVAWGIR